MSVGVRSSGSTRPEGSGLISLLLKGDIKDLLQKPSISGPAGTWKNFAKARSTFDV